MNYWARAERTIWLVCVFGDGDGSKVFCYVLFSMDMDSIGLVHTIMDAS